jgi:hypothetical protein
VGGVPPGRFDSGGEVACAIGPPEADYRRDNRAGFPLVLFDKGTGACYAAVI